MTQDTKGRGSANQDESSAKSSPVNFKKTVAAVGVLDKIGPKKSGISQVASSLRLKSAASSKSKSNTKLKDPKTLRLEAHKLAAVEKFKKLGTASCLNSSSGKSIDDKGATKSDEEIGIPGKVWDHEIAKLGLKQKRSSVIFREIGAKHIRVIPATPNIYQVGVKREKSPGKRTFYVLRPAAPDVPVIQTEFKGPRFNDYGEIVPHSILGDADSFFEQAQLNGDFQELTPSSFELTGSPHKKRFPVTPTLDPPEAGNRSLEQWRTEMKIRQETQRVLADKTNRPEHDLLMCRSDAYEEKKTIQRLLEHENKQFDPNVCFWRQEERLGCQQIIPTFTKSERGSQPTPEVLGHADPILAEKSKCLGCSRKPGSFMRSEYLQERIANSGGTVKIANTVLFNNLLISGQPASIQNQSNNGHSLDKESNSEDDLAVKVENSVYDTAIKTDNSSSEVIEGNAIDVLFHRLNNIKREKLQIQGPAICVDGKILIWKGPLNPVAKENSSDSIGPMCNYDDKKNGKIHHQNVSCNNSRNQSAVNNSGPHITTDNDGVVNMAPSNSLGCHGDHVAMETTVYVEGQVDEVVKCHAVFKNVGTTAIRYWWMKVKEERTLPIPRLFKKVFYFHDDCGVVGPDETQHVTMLFRSQYPGNYSETWLLRTEPVLERGAQIRFIFRGVAKQHKDYGRQVQDIEKYLAEREVQTICRDEAYRIIDKAVLEAFLRKPWLHEDTVTPTAAELFVQENPKLHYHAHIVQKLQILNETVSLETQGLVAGQPDTFTEKMEAPVPGLIVNGLCQREKELLENAGTVNIDKLRQTLLALPEEESKDSDDEEEEEDKSCTNFTRKQVLLWQLYRDVGVLSFAPYRVMSSDYQTKYSVVLSLLQSGIDKVVDQSVFLAEKFELVSRETEEQEVKSVEKLEPVKKVKQQKTPKSRQKVNKSAKGGKNKGTSPTESVAPVASFAHSSDQSENGESFSPVNKCRQRNEPKDAPLLKMYDEKVYLQMYGMLQSVVDDMAMIFNKE